MFRPRAQFGIQGNMRCDVPTDTDEPRDGVVLARYGAKRPFHMVDVVLSPKPQLDTMLGQLPQGFVQRLLSCWAIRRHNQVQECSAGSAVGRRGEQLPKGRVGV